MSLRASPGCRILWGKGFKADPRAGEAVLTSGYNLDHSHHPAPGTLAPSLYSILQ